jgi:hypothetical protein
MVPTLVLLIIVTSHRAATTQPKSKETLHHEGREACPEQRRREREAKKLNVINSESFVAFVLRGDMLFTQHSSTKY